MAPNLDDLLALIGRKSRLPEKDVPLWEAFWRLYPRFRFLKTLPLDAHLLDIGAGSGGLIQWRDWLSPMRPDLQFYGVDLSRGEFAGRYADWRVANLDEGLPQFQHPFDGFLASHLIEHLASPAALFSAMRRQARPGARVYLEWPHPRTQHFPKATELAAHGFVMQTLNFFDDGTHIATPSRAEILSQLDAAGFEEVEGGDISLGLLAEEVLVRGRKRDDLTWRQMGLWAATGWSQYVIARAKGGMGGG